MKHYLLFYHYRPDYMEKRGDSRGPHMAHLKKAAEEGSLVFGGACMDGDPLGLLLFKTDSKELVEEFARTDPYITSGLSTGWEVREYFMLRHHSGDT